MAQYTTLPTQTYTDGSSNTHNCIIHGDSYNTGYYTITVFWADGRSPSVVYNVPASSLTTSHLVSTDIPNLDASKITTGTFSSSRIPVLWGQILTGQCADGQTLLSSSSTVHYLQVGAQGTAQGLTNTYALIQSIPSWAQSITSISVTFNNALTGSGGFSFVLKDGTSSTTLSTLTVNSSSGGSVSDGISHTLTAGHYLTFTYAGNGTSGGSIGNIAWEIHIN
jgi:hypothetical protein